MWRPQPDLAGRSRDVVTDGMDGLAQVAILSAPWNRVARPMIESARSQPVRGVPVRRRPDLIALGVLAPEGSVGAPTGPQVVELAARSLGWADASETFKAVAGTLPEINQVSLGQAIWERWQDEQRQHYPNGANRLRDLQTRLGLGPSTSGTCRRSGPTFSGRSTRRRPGAPPAGSSRYGSTRWDDAAAGLEPDLERSRAWWSAVNS